MFLLCYPPKSILKIAMARLMKSHESPHGTEEFAVVSDIASPELRDVLDIYHEAFPNSERQPTDEIKRRIVDGRYGLLVAKTDNVVVAFALYYVFERLSFGLFDYMAVRKEYRNLEIGSRLFLRTYEHFGGRNPSSKLMLFEIENPAYGSTSERSLRLRRLRWFERLGAKRIANFEYLMPPMSGDRPTEMLLMVYSRDDQQGMNSDTLRQMVKAIYDEVYGREADDPYLRRMLQGLADTSRIQLIGRNT